MEIRLKVTRDVTFSLNHAEVGVNPLNSKPRTTNRVVCRAGRRKGGLNN